MKKNILIVGAGPVGLTAAYELSRRGFQPRLIDKAEDFAPLHESRALGIHLRTLDIFEAGGLSGQLRKAGNLITEMRFHNDGKCLANIDLSRHPRSDAGILSLPQGQTERIIAKTLEKTGITPEWQNELLGLENHTSGAKVHIRLPDGEDQTIDYDMVIGCDGAHSQARKSGGFSFEGEATPDKWVIADVVYHTASNPHTANANFVKGLGRIVGLPIDDHKIRYIGNNGELMQHIPRKDDIKDIPWQSEFKVSYRMVSRFHRGRVFLAGDAAHIHSPAGGRGMNLGIEDAAWLAWMISEGTEAGYSQARLPMSPAASLCP